MINIKIDSFGGRAYVLSEDLEAGKEIIYFGRSKPFECDVADTDEAVERNMEGILTHESCHIVVYQLTNDMMSTIGVDNMDNEENDWPISGGLFSWL